MSDEQNAAPLVACSFDGSQGVAIGTIPGSNDALPLSWSIANSYEPVSNHSAMIGSFSGMSYDGTVTAGNVVGGEVLRLSTGGLEILSGEAQSIGLSGDGASPVMAIQESFLLERALPLELRGRTAPA